MVTAGSCCNARLARTSLDRSERKRQALGFVPRAWPGSRPVQNDCPAPLTTTTCTVTFSAICSNKSASQSRIGPSTRLPASGRFRVTTVTTPGETTTGVSSDTRGLQLHRCGRKRSPLGFRSCEWGDNQAQNVDHADNRRCDGDASERRHQPTGGKCADYSSKAREVEDQRRGRPTHTGWEQFGQIHRHPRELAKSKKAVDSNNDE